MALTWMRKTGKGTWHIIHDMRNGLVQARCGEVLDHGIVRMNKFPRCGPVCKKCAKFTNTDKKG